MENGDNGIIRVENRDKGKIIMENGDKGNIMVKNRRRTGSHLVELQDRERRACSMPTTRNSFGLLPLGYCERNNLNLEKTTSSVLSVILINLWSRAWEEEKWRKI